MTNFICWNCRGFNNKRDEIRDIISDHRSICFVFQETHLTKNDKVTFRGYTTFGKDYHSSERATGGVALLVSNDFPHNPIPLNTHIQAVAVQIHIRQLITVCTLYLPPDYSLQQHDLNSLIMQLPTPFAILGDFNAHSPLWGSPDANLRGQLIEDFITGNSLCVVNNVDNTYFHEPSKTFHAIDLFICSPILFPYFIFSVSNDLHSSDHFPLFISFHDFNHVYPKNSRYIYDKANWSTFTSNAIITPAMTQGDINDAVALITKNIIKAADKSIPKSSGRTGKHCRPWWNEECQLSKKKQPLDYNSPFTINELSNSLKSCHLSAPGLDDITYQIIKHLSQNSLNNLLLLYNRIYAEHVFPAAWHDAIVIPFPKPGKDTTDPKNYRPIALTSCLCKILEKIVNNRLVCILEQRKLISPWQRQSGFRRGRSTTDNILMLEANIRNANL